MIFNEIDFIAWLDKQLDEEVPEGILAFNINVNESPFNIELIGSDEFTPNDEDWACNEDWVPINRSMTVSDELFGDSWEVAESNLLKFSKAYLDSNAVNVYKLTKAKAFSVGFVDGSLNFVV
jgi:hypothetical protein